MPVVLERCKLGTIPFGQARVKSRRTFPKQGDKIYILNTWHDRYRGERVNKCTWSRRWISVVVTKYTPEIDFYHLDYY